MGAVAVIPARGGSKRIPGKNVREFGGLPIIAWSIRAALDAGIFERVMVSTDSADIAEIAKAHGAEVPFLRPAELSDDVVGVTHALEHALLWLKEQGEEPAFACMLYATAPLLAAEDIQRGYEALSASPDATFAMSVTSFAFPVLRALKMGAGGCLEPVWPDYFEKNSQDIEEYYHDAGQFLWVRSEAFLANAGKLTNEKNIPVIVDRWRVQDLDTEVDWERLERMFQASRC